MFTCNIPLIIEVNEISCQPQNTNPERIENTYNLFANFLVRNRTTIRDMLTKHPPKLSASSHNELVNFKLNLTGC